MQTADRRPIAARKSRWALAALQVLLRTSATANQISLLGIVFAALGAWALVETPRSAAFFLVAALLIQLRLLCNMMDGLLAVEGGRGSPVGALYNEVPDRLEDALLLIGFGYAAALGWLGFVAALLAISTAYLRMVGAAQGFPQDFRGPMAKPQRMAALTIGCALGFFEILAAGTRYSLTIVLVAVVLGTALTCVRRLATTAALMQAARR